METEWDYTKLADAYLERPEYAPEALSHIFDIAGLREESLVCDVGAGVAHLTIPLARRGCQVIAVEPNDAMRANGQKRTAGFANVRWVDATGEDTGQQAGMFDFVSFGSSFNVTNRTLALKETHRLLKAGSWFVCMWNHRDLGDAIQATIEEIIRSFIPDYGYGSRREDQTGIISDSGLFTDIQTVSGQVLHVQSIPNVVEAWRSHGTLHRQAGAKFEGIIAAIDQYLQTLCVQDISIPYTTRAWVARKA